MNTKFAFGVQTRQARLDEAESKDGRFTDYLFQFFPGTRYFPEQENDSKTGNRLMASVVTEYLFQLIAKQVEDRGLVVWDDPE